MDASRPWWASEEPVEGAADPDEDPVTAHRRARRGPVPGGERHAAGEPTTEADVCGVCPVCTAARVLSETRPELLDHLLEAGRHLAAALRTLLDAPTGAPPGADGHRDPGVRRVDLD